MGADTNWDIPEPTTLNARKQLDSLLVSLPAGSPLTASFCRAISQNKLLPTLSRFMLQPSLTSAISWAFRPLLLDLCARWLDADEEDDYQKLEALGLLIEIHEELFPILSSFVRRFERGPLFSFVTGKDIERIGRLSLHCILLAYYRILRATPTLPTLLNWDLASLLKLCANVRLDRGTRWLAIRCYSIQANMCESTRIVMEQDALGKICVEDCPIIYGEDISGIMKEVDGWILPVLEVSRIREYRNRILESPDYFEESEMSDIEIKNTDLSPRIVNVHGILLLRSPPFRYVMSFLVPTSPAVFSLRLLAVNVSLRRPTLLTSAPSSGKASFLHYLASLLHPSSPNQVVTIHLADTSLDPRSLLGSYVSSSTTTGGFEWKDGVLVKAMREGRWVVLKDIDRTSNEILGLIAPLVESMDDIRPIGSNASLSLGNRGTVEAAESFSLFATRSVEGEHTPPLVFLGAEKWKEILVPENSLDDLRQIVDSKFPQIAGPVADVLIDIWLTAKRFRVLSSTRTIGIRDLEKFCSRVSHVLQSSRAIPRRQRHPGGDTLSAMALMPHPALREELYLEARDIFFAAGALNQSAAEQRHAVAGAIADNLGLSEETRIWLLNRRTPAFEIRKDVDGRPISIRAGRTVLNIDSVHAVVTPARPFSMHSQALRLISQIAACVSAKEPVLLTGETGTGKTSVISHLASMLNKNLVSLNLSNQTESADLIGGFRPVSARVPALELQQHFMELFHRTFSSKKNEQLLQGLRKAMANEKWKAAVKLWTETARTAMVKLTEKRLEMDISRPKEALDIMDSPTPRKRRKIQHEDVSSSQVEWAAFHGDVQHFEIQYVLDKGKFSFRYVEGPLVKAIRSGGWVLLDEINLASPETLECITSLLQGPDASITLTEQGALEPVPRHSGFRLFACMNPATDVGKKELPSNVRAKFTEIEVPPADDDPEALMAIITHYIGHLAVTEKSAISNVAELYTSMKQLASLGKIADVSGHKPHYSMRSLSRALIFAADTIQNFGLRRALWEGFVMAFTMILDRSSTEVVLDLVRRTLLPDVKNAAHFLAVQLTPPQNDGLSYSYVQFGSFWLSSGANEREEVPDYILTPSVQKKLVDLARIAMTKRYPILIEGPTSSGKTSSIQYLARRTGHNFVRINNHEHTDIQEYLGSYVSDPKTGKLVFQDGLLVRALRRGDWIVLDELNLAPTDVLEALNRLLDDNRELVIPETQETVRPHPHFMLFATQNPPGVYAGRKVLSRALRSRFLEVQFEDVPSAELEHILCQRSRIAPSYSQRIVAVFHELQKRRQVGRIFEGKEGFATLRDLFRWACRDAQSYQELAENGYMLLAERTRRLEDKLVVKEVIETIMKVSISESSLYCEARLGSALGKYRGIIWTKPMQRLFILLSNALRHEEPVLLIGETGSGKTSVCQVYAEVENKVLRAVNCHQNTEAADIIGGLRPVRHAGPLELEIVQEALNVLNLVSKDKGQIAELIEHRLLEDLSSHERGILLAARRALMPSNALITWQDGPLVTSMCSAGIFLLDEISLADDSVLERLNSVLEPSRTLVLAEKGGDFVDEFHVVAKPGFQFVATMNPGGDFGKKELSPALRNRFTEIWVPSLMNRDDLSDIIKRSWKYDKLLQLTTPMLDFIDWMLCEAKDTSILTLRDIMSWISFCNTLSRSTDLSPSALFVHGGEMSILDGLSSLTQFSSWSTEALRAFYQRGKLQLFELTPERIVLGQTSTLDVRLEGPEFRIGPFSISTGSQPPRPNSFSFKAPTSLRNAFRLVRACQIEKPILLEGSPGVGKTSLVAALATAAGQKLCRINLSEQTDLVDLFGSDLPMEGRGSGSFGWNDADFLRALKNGDWVLLDEMNLASQSVLEGLNAIFDHRGTVYVPELDRLFLRHPKFRVFAAQNPLNQGSGRKGLPKSFLNRFTKIYVEQLSPNDLLLVCQHLYPNIDPLVLQTMISFNSRLHEDVVIQRRFGLAGAPWEFNLRDIMRWATLMIRPDGSVEEPWKHVNTVYGARFREESDKLALFDLFANVFDDIDVATKIQPAVISTPEHLGCGSTFVQKGLTSGAGRVPCVLPSQLREMEAALSSMSQNWLVIVTGPSSSGKTAFIRALASVSSHSLEEMSLGSSSDTSDLIGGYEQLDVDFHIQRLLERVLRVTDACITHSCIGSIHSLELLLKLKEEAVAARKTLSLSRLQDMIRACLQSPLFVDEDLRAAMAASLDISNLCESPGPGFQWVDGPLVRAMREGQWLLLDNANLCSPSVLDRLNSLCEMNGLISLTEKGADQESIHPHPDFRLIMGVNPFQGEISRAMRNRGVEIFLDPSVRRDDIGLLIDAKRLPMRDPSSTSRVAFELTRRALRRASPVVADLEVLYPICNENYWDTLACKTLEIKELYDQCDSDCDLAIILFIFCYSSPFTSRGLIRLLESFGTSRGASLAEQLSLSLEVSDNLRLKFASVPRSQQIIQEHHRPLHPYLFPSHINWLSDEDEETCITLYITLETLVLVSGIELAISRRSSMPVEYLEHQRDVPASEEHQTVTRFVQVVTSNVRSVILESQLKNTHSNAAALLDLVLCTQLLHAAANCSVADFSTLYVLSERIFLQAKDVSHFIQGLEGRAAELHDAYSLHTGQKVGEIWRALYQPAMSTRALDLLSRSALQPLDVQLRVADLVSLACATQATSVELSAEFRLMEEKVIERVDEERLASMEAVRTGCNLALVAIEMNDLARLNPFIDKSNLKKTIHLLRHSARFAQHALRVVAYQLLSWKLDANRDVIPEIGAAHLYWHRSIWQFDELAQVSGPQALYTPLLLRSAIAASSNALSGTLKDIKYRRSLLGDHLLSNLSECFRDSSRESLLLAFLLRSVELTLCACFPGLDKNVFRSVGHEADSEEAIAVLVKVLQDPLFEVFGSLRIALEEVTRSATWPGQLHALGKCWILLSQILLALYVPNIPIDPRRVEHCRKSFRKAQYSWINAQIHVHAVAEYTRTGKRDNIFTRHFKDRLQKLGVESDMDDDQDRRSDLSMLQSFWNETRNFMSERISAERLKRFILNASEGVKDLLSQEVLLQDSIMSYIQRMKSAYSSLQDLVPAIELAMMQLRFGLRTLLHSSTLLSSSSNLCLREIIKFPSVAAQAAISNIATEELAERGFQSFDALLLKLVGLSQRVHIGQSSSRNFVEIRRLYDQISVMWNVDLARSIERARQANSWYRSRQYEHHAPDDDPSDEEVHNLFPTFTKDEQQEDSAGPMGSRTSGSGFALSAEFARRLLHIHLLLFGGQIERSHRDLSSLWSLLRSRVVSGWVDGPLTSLPSYIDDDSLAFRLGLLNDAKVRLEQAKVGGAYSFYHDPDLRQARTAANIVTELRDTLSQLLRLWPDQLVLQHLLDHCDSILAMNMRSSVAKMLGAIERLLLHTEDWELFANRANSLSTHRQYLTELIVSWRKLELEGWESLLESEAESFCDELGNWWFRLYDATVRGSIAASEEITPHESLNHYLDSLVPLLEEFITSSPLGQFKRRLRMIWSFASMTSTFSTVDDASGEIMRRVSFVLFSLHQFFEQFASKIDANLVEQRRLIGRDIQNLVKLATWRDFNVHALRQSAQRTHKQLYKNIRKFRELLRQSITSQLRTEDSSVGPSLNVDDVQPVISLIGFGGFDTNGTPRAYAKFVSVLSNDLDQILNSSSAHAMEELSHTVITVQHDYTKILPSGDLSVNERKKWNSALLARKRRSWNDLLKELKRIGFSSNIKPDVSQRHRNRRNLMEQPRLDSFEGTKFASKSTKVDSYFYRSMSLLDDLLRFDANHHLDIATREMQRGISLFESAFFFATDARSRIFHLTKAWSRIRAITQKLQVLKHTRGTCMAASTAEIFLDDVKNKLMGTTEAFDELVDIATNFLDSPNDGTTLRMDSLDDLRQWMSISRSIREGLSDLSKDLDISKLFTEADKDIVYQAVKHIENAEPLLIALASREPNIRRFCESIQRWSAEHPIDTSHLNFIPQPSALQTDTTTVINCLLLVGQDLLEVENSMKVKDDDGTGHACRQYAMHMRVSRILRMDRLLNESYRLVQTLYGKSGAAISDLIDKVVPFLGSYVTFVERYILQYFNWTISLLKLTYISGLLIRNVARNGFCKPPEVDESDEAEGAAESADGAGLGQGEGKENVSNQIEDESQFEGMKGEEETSNDASKEGDDDNALDVDFDLGGEFHDGPEQDSSSEDDDEAPDLDDEFGQDLSDDLEKVDENFWDEQQDKKSADGQDIGGGDERGDDSETVAKEKENRAKESLPKTEPEIGNDLQEQDQNALEDREVIPEDAELDHAQKHETEAVDDTVESSQHDDLSAESNLSERPEEMTNDLEHLNFDEELQDTDSQSQCDQSEAEGDGEGDGEGDAILPEDKGVPHDGEGDEGNAELLSKADVHAGPGVDDSLNMGMDQTMGISNEDSQASDRTMVAPLPSTAVDAKKSTATKDSADRRDNIEAAANGASHRDSGSQGQTSDRSTSMPSNAPLPNPHRSLGSALREVRRRFDEIRSAAGAEPLPTTLQDNGAREVALEYVTEDTGDVDMQALGPALGEEGAKLNRLNLLEEDANVQDIAIPEPIAASEGDNQDHGDASPTAQPENENNESARRRNGQNMATEVQQINVDRDSHDSGDLLDILSDIQEENQSKTVEIELDKWFCEGQPKGSGEYIWQLYDALTQSLSFSLCEQLRLILEPTKATRLMGDFRTGKRLNMKKIIPYIASNYTKDKIWLRRVRPSQREYQILIALDDSHSMAESHSIHLAFQTLALVSKALNRLEVGDVAIASFGEKTEMLHGFEDGPFTDHAGTQVVESFRFAQTATNVRSLLESSVEVLMKARERRSSFSTSNLWQLEIIISDGICQDHEELRAILRKAEEEHILVVFIVIDALHDSQPGELPSNIPRTQNSILNMNQAMYRSVNGRLELHMQRYLDSFPFEFFVILKNVEALPDVLAGTLRQFFERIYAS